MEKIGSVFSTFLLIINEKVKKIVKSKWQKITAKTNRYQKITDITASKPKVGHAR